jgi:hypothetical protein
MDRNFQKDIRLCLIKSLVKLAMFVKDFSSLVALTPSTCVKGNFAAMEKIPDRCSFFLGRFYFSCFIPYHIVTDL